MINTTRWSPDTCDCVLEYEWDSESSEDTRVHIPTSVSRKCEEHKNEIDTQVHVKVKDENTTKNKVLQEIIDTLPIFGKLDAGGNRQPDLDKIVWAFDANRKLQINLVGGTAFNKITLRTSLAAKFSNKVNIL